MPPAIKGYIEVMRQLGEILLNPLIGVPAYGIGCQFGCKVLDDALEACLECVEGAGHDVQTRSHLRLERHLVMVIYNQPHDGGFDSVLFFQPGHTDFRDGEGVEVCQQQFSVTEVETRRLYGTGHELCLLLEVMAIMR